VSGKTRQVGSPAPECEGCDIRKSPSIGVVEKELREIRQKGRDGRIKRPQATGGLRL